MDPEDQKAQDERVEKLWQTLDTRKEGRLNTQSLKEGLGRMDHRKYFAVSSESMLIAR